MDKIKIEMRGRCVDCGTERSIFCAYVQSENDMGRAMDKLEEQVDKIGAFDANCPKCGQVEEVAMFFNNKQSEPWQNAADYERENGPDAGPLPEKPW